MTHTPPICNFYALEDDSISINGRIIAKAGEETSVRELTDMLHRANTQPDLLAALERVADWYACLQAQTVSEWRTGDNAMREVRAAIDKATS